ncbi:MAG: hypothetical protein M1331_02085 [Candidatus Marsarchaeota archaeon]|nr:hypothetical protein [Candidatus Marsarchaeota archaeon]MCL5106164.1 hypothetical protein [Candidatus Marsarchaeota archaeon]
MSEIGILYRLYPSEGSDIEELGKKLQQEAGAASTEVEEIGFGIKVIKALFKYNDEKTNSSDIESKIRAVKGVEQIEVIEESLI